MNKLPKDFKPNDSHREYCSQKWGYPNLADVFLTDFVECFEQNEKRHKNWDLTYKTYIRNNSPEGRYYNAPYWERAILKAKSLQYGSRTRRTPQYDPRGAQPEKPAEKHVVEAAMSKLRGMLSGI